MRFKGVGVLEPVVDLVNYLAELVRVRLFQKHAFCLAVFKILLSEVLLDDVTRRHADLAILEHL